LVRLAQGDADEALRELARERQLAQPHRLYSREYEMSSLTGCGACLLRVGRADEAVDCFRRALELYPDHAQSNLGLSIALRAMGSLEVAETNWCRARASLDTLTLTRPIEAAMVLGQLLAAENRPGDVDAVLCRALDDAPPGFAAWTMPIEPFLVQPLGAKAFAAALSRLFERAR
jgi:tetratricopeptide (TPR) repeat protein